MEGMGPERLSAVLADEAKAAALYDLLKEHLGAVPDESDTEVAAASFDTQPESDQYILDVVDIPKVVQRILLRTEKSKFEQALREILASSEFDVLEKMALVARLHDIQATPPARVGLRQLHHWGSEPGLTARPDWAALVEPAPVPAGRRKEHNNRLLLVVHGTFSSSENLMGRFPSTVRMATEQTYAAVLGYNHFTLSESPRVNAKRLFDALSAYLDEQNWHDAQIDIICHSRGGLVVRGLIEKHWLRSQRPLPIKHVHFVATPNGGTHFASPDNLADMVDHATWLKVLGGLASRMAGIPSVSDLLDLLDTPQEALTVLHAIPGLAAQSPESSFLLELNDGNPGVDRRKYPTYSAACADHQPQGNEPDDGLFKALLRSLGVLRSGTGDPSLKETIIDQIFGGRPNDLMVDTDSVLQIHDQMGEAVIDPDRVIAFVHPDRLAVLRSKTNGRFLRGVKNVVKRGDVDHSGFFKTKEWAEFVITELEMKR